MSIYLLADKDSEKTVISMEEIRKFITDMAEMNLAIKTAKTELKTALEEDLKLDELKDVAKQARQAVKTYIESHTVYKEYIEKLETLISEKKDMIADAKVNGIPKKEIDIAVKALRSDIDLNTSTEIYASISDLVE